MFGRGSEARSKYFSAWTLSGFLLLGGGLEPPRLTAYAPQTYVSAISPPERFGGTQLVSRTMFPASVSSGRRSVVSGQLSVASCQWPVVSGQWAVGSGQWAVG